ncbi:MAG: dephospho-CoA kinase [Desulfovibrionaceae bacterium]
MVEQSDPTASVEAALIFSTEGILLPTRLDLFLAQTSYCLEHGISRERIKEYIKRGCISRNGNTLSSASYKVERGTDISLHIPKTISMLEAEEGDVEIVYEDNDILIINKQINTVVHPCTSHPDNTLLQKLLFHYPDIRSIGGERPGIVHRLDKDTTGLLIIARTERARQILMQDFASRTVEKKYLALVEGKTPERGTISSPIGRDPISKVRMAVLPNGKKSISHYKTLYTTKLREAKQSSLLLVTIETGRTHQIRVHCASLGHPLLGDALYKGTAHSKYPRPMLHAYNIAFTHPTTKKRCSFTVEPPQDFVNAFLDAENTHMRVVITGSAGSGKSTFLEYFSTKSIPTWSADAIVRQLYEVGRSGWHYLRKSYGNRFIKDDTSPVDRGKLLHAFLQSPAIRKEIERSIHYYVLEDLKAFWNTKQHSYSIAEIPLYFELGLDKQNIADISICVHISEEIQKERLQKRQWSKEKIEYCIQSQETSISKCAKADYILENISNKETYILAIQKMEQILEEIQENQKKKQKEFFYSLLKKTKIKE